MKFIPINEPAEPGFADIIFHRKEKDGEEVIECEWRGDRRLPVKFSRDFLRDLTPEGNHFNIGLRALPWPMKIIGVDAEGSDYFLAQRTD